MRLLYAWLHPKEFRDVLDRLEDAQGDYLLTDPGAGFYRDACCASEFAALIGADLVRLVPEQRPDFQISTTGSEIAFEVTEADIPGRKRGAEAQERRKRRVPGQPFVGDFPYADWLTPGQADIALRAAAERKNRDVYDPSWGLIILLNPIEFGAHQRAIEGIMVSATASVRNRFSSVWVLWKGVGYNTWQKGQASTHRLAHPGASFATDLDT